MNKLVEWETSIDPVWIECTQLKNDFLSEIFGAFCVVVGVIRKIKMARNWFGRICVVFLYIS